jgi:UDP-N-acetylglucosamine 1-carboxyvinyltransferase
MQGLGGAVQENCDSVSVALLSGTRPVAGNIALRFPSVGATENIMMAAALADGTTVIENSAREPEIIDLADFLNKMGAKVIGAGESTITVIGARELRPAKHRVIPDRIEAGTYLVAGAMTAGRVTLRDARPDQMTATLEQLSRTGCRITTEPDRVTIEAPDVIRPADCRTLPYPGFSTDIQPPFMALMTRAAGESLFVENIFDRRFLAADELCRMQADIRVLENCALVSGGRRLVGCEVNAPDIRAAAALITAGLWAEGTTRVRGLEHLYRGYEDPVEKLSALGARIGEKSPLIRTQSEASGA